MRKVLIANRGEVVSRVARTCAARGIATLAVYTVFDKDLPFVRCADQAVLVESYLDADSMVRLTDVSFLSSSFFFCFCLSFLSQVRVALSHGCDAVHPGWGFLSENADFAELVSRAGLLWIGPSAER